MRVFSGIRPSGDIHIGNYLGAIKQWLELQKRYECVFCIVDWHAITTPYDPKKIQNNIFELAVAYLAAGIDPKKTTFFVQSQVKEHAELAWLLGIVIPTGELFRMTQYKEKSEKLKQKSSAGLLNYPILMAADILLYQTDIVPVGEDQVQHVELARDIARKFNRRFGQTFKIPKAQVPKTTARIKSLQNPDKKMSKSDDPKGCIGLFDEPEQIKTKIMNAVTDTGKEIKYDPENKPGISNLLTIYSGFAQKPIGEIEKEFQGKGYAQFKQSLAELLIKELQPFRKAKKQSSEAKIQKVLDLGADKARKIAQPTITKVRANMGLR
jgi:tryptophanyl-tRNA synthetase